jgi:hypothetical protein
MDKRHTTTVLREMLREQICCLGRIVARHQVPDDVVWEITKGFDVIYQRTRRQVEVSTGGPEVPLVPYRMDPHPGLTYLMEKLDLEVSSRTGEAIKK